MESNPDDLRRRIEQGLAAAPGDDDARSLLLASVIGAPSRELEAMLAAPSRRAAVLVGLIDRPGGVNVLLTERARHLTHHAGQISFPGGQLEHELESPVEAALREASEEVGLAPNAVSVLGQLSAQLTGTGFVITPVIGWVGPAFEARPDPAEVESVFEVPLGHLLMAANRRSGTRERWGTHFRTHEFLYERYRIWGATAAILARVLEVINEKTI